jgi:hypothetical protein
MISSAAPWPPTNKEDGGRRSARQWQKYQASKILNNPSAFGKCVTRAYTRADLQFGKPQSPRSRTLLLCRFCAVPGSRGAPGVPSSSGGAVQRGDNRRHRGGRQIIDRITHPSRSPAPSPFLLGPKQSEASSSSRGRLLQDPLTSCNFVLPPRPRGRQPACSQSRQLPCLRACRIRYSNLPLLPCPPLPSQKLPQARRCYCCPISREGKQIAFVIRSLPISQRLPDSKVHHFHHFAFS